MTRALPVVREPATFSWTARCEVCGALVFSVTDEAVRRGPRRPSGASALLPVTMSVGHICPTWPV